MPKPRIESLLSARLFVAPELHGDRIYFISNLSGRFSLYAMNYGGSVPEPLLPPDISLQNPELLGGYSYTIFPKLGKILVSIDNNGDEKYQPMLIPIEGGFPERAFPQITGARVFIYPRDEDENLVYLSAASLNEAVTRIYQASLATGETLLMGESPWEGYCQAANDDNTQAIVTDGYTPGDLVLYLWKKSQDPAERHVLYGVPLEQRTPGQVVPPNAITNITFTPGNVGLLFTTALFEDTYSPAYMLLEKPDEIKPVALSGLVHAGRGELTGMEHLHDDLYLLKYNIDGASWAYEASFNERNLTLQVQHVICGQGELSNGVAEAIEYDKGSDRYVLSFSTASSPTQIYTVEGPDRETLVLHTHERILGIPHQWLSDGEDYSFTSYDGEQVSARLYLPASALGFEGRRPLVYYIHGGPQGQERPNFAWFSMPIIQFLTLNGFAVFVPNVRGSEGYGLSYMKKVDHDWGGNDRLDHVYAMEHLLPKDDRIDVSRAGVMGRSYGGYMTLTLASRHPNLWKAAIDMFGPYNLLTFIDRLPETWKPYFYIAIGEPEKDRDFLLERSPYTYVQDISCPLLVIQGANDPRVIERESRDVVEKLQGMGKEVDYIVFENEGHDVIKFENKVRCYNAITDFFKEHLQP